MLFLKGDKSIRTLMLLWICFMLRGLFYSVLFPLWEGYDEYAHFAFIQHLVTAGTLPTAATPISKEVEESLKLAPLPWTLRHLEPPHSTHDEYWRLSQDERRRRQEQLAALPRDWACQPAAPNNLNLNWEAQQPPLYYWLLSFPLRLAWNVSLPGRVLLLRLLSLGLASLVIPLGYLVAKQVFSSRNAALGTVALIAVMPELLVNVCRVGNESLAILLYSLLMVAAFRFVENPERSGTFMLLAVSLGLGLLTKAYFLTALPALLAILACYFFFDPAKRSSIAFRGLSALAAALSLSGWWYWRNRVLTGSWSGVMPDAALRDISLWKLLGQVPRVDWKNALDSLLLSHMWFGNWSFLQVRSWITHVFGYLIPPALLGLVLLFVFWRLNGNAQFSFLASRMRLLVPVAFYGFFWLGLLYHILITFAAQGISASQGWYLYCLVVAEVLVMMTGLLALCPAVLRPWIIPAATIGFSLLDLYTVHFLLAPYYSGLIAHNPSGALATFHVELLNGLDLWNYVGRLAVNKSLLNRAGFLFLWIGYLAATVGLVAIGVRIGWLQAKSMAATKT